MTLPRLSHRLRRRALAGVAFVSLAMAGVPAHAQWTVFDPSNFSQNILTAARSLQQINNQITSLQNQAQMLINRKRCSAALLPG
jgi:P-type conjugative transfer protein TrbJ